MAKKWLNNEKLHNACFLILEAVAGAVALQGFASSPEHIATHAPL
jgi:hypothetical protein